MTERAGNQRWRHVEPQNTTRIACVCPALAARPEESPSEDEDTVEGPGGLLEELEEVDAERTLLSDPDKQSKTSQLPLTQLHLPSFLVGREAEPGCEYSRSLNLAC